MIADLPHALRDNPRFLARLDSRRPVMFLDYDGTLTPIVDRPEDAVISEGMRDAVRRLTGRTTVCVVSGRDRPVPLRRTPGKMVHEIQPSLDWDKGKADTADPAQANRATAAEFVLESIGEVQRFLDTLALPSGA